MPTNALRDATRLACAAVAKGFSCVAAIGGDGTVNEVAQGLIGSDVALGLVPCGSGNGLAHHLGISLNTDRALADHVSPQRRLTRIDTGTANDHAFVTVMGCGFAFGSATSPTITKVARSSSRKNVAEPKQRRAITRRTTSRPWPTWRRWLCLSLEKRQRFLHRVVNAPCQRHENQHPNENDDDAFHGLMV